MNGDLPSSPADSTFSLRSAYAHLVGRSAHESMATALPANPDSPITNVLNAGRKVVVSRTPTDRRVGQHHHRRHR